VRYRIRIRNSEFLDLNPGGQFITDPLNSEPQHKVLLIHNVLPIRTCLFPSDNDPDTDPEQPFCFCADPDTGLDLTFHFDGDPDTDLDQAFFFDADLQTGIGSDFPFQWGS
jgi:hypothetical protein